jgi:hypothetical protein
MLRPTHPLVPILPVAVAGDRRRLVSRPNASPIFTGWGPKL